jgi:hypothetical protein
MRGESNWLVSRAGQRRNGNQLGTRRRRLCAGPGASASDEDTGRERRASSRLPSHGPCPQGAPSTGGPTVRDRHLHAPRSGAAAHGACDPGKPASRRPDCSCVSGMDDTVHIAGLTRGRPTQIQLARSHRLFFPFLKVSQISFGRIHMLAASNMEWIDNSVNTSCRRTQQPDLLVKGLKKAYILQ